VLPEWGGSVERGTPVVLGIRPEDFAFREKPGSTAVLITLVEPMGSSTIVYTELGEKLVAIETGKDTSLSVGSSVSLEVDPKRLHLFDASTGRSLASAQYRVSS
jgi:multiple sugar transport system ATP-binding protein